MPKITKRLVDASEPKTEHYLIWDDEVKGFCLRVHSTGVKSYVLKYRARGRQGQITFGRHGPMTPAEARNKAIKLLAEIHNGNDPTPRARLPTVADVCSRYLEEHVAQHNKPRTAGEMKRLVQNRVIPALGKMRIAEVQRQDVLRLYYELRQTKYEANRTLGLLSKLFNLAELWGLRPEHTNPCRMIQRYREQARERYFTDEEMVQLGKTIHAMEHEFAIPRGVAIALKLLALTGCRRMEILDLQWAHVDAVAGVLRLADAKTDARVVTLNEAALELLAGLSREHCWVVPGCKAGEPLNPGTLQQAFKRIRQRAGIANARIHDLRHTVATYAVQAGGSAYAIREMLRHESTRMGDRYVARAADPQRTLNNRVGGRISAAFSGKSAEVVPLSKKSAS